jgi:hypothetical protein
MEVANFYSVTSQTILSPVLTLQQQYFLLSNPGREVRAWGQSRTSEGGKNGRVSLKFCSAMNLKFFKDCVLKNSDYANFLRILMNI